jgi:hypothetical protein
MVSYQSHSNTTPASATSCVVTKPTGLAVGDLMVGHLGVSASASPVADLPSGWTSVINTSNGNHRARAFYKIADSSDVAASDFTFTGSGTDCIIGGAIYRINGQGVTTVIDASNSTTFSGTSIDVNAAVTPTRANDILLALISGNSINLDGSMTGTIAVATDNPTWTEDYDMNLGSGNLPMVGGHSNSRAATTSTGNISFSFDNGVTAGIVMLLAIANTVSVTVSPDPVTSTGTIPAPTPSGGAVVLVNPVTSSATANDASADQADWSAAGKNSTSFTAEAKGNTTIYE